jgi:hypothetical protein
LLTVFLELGLQVRNSCIARAKFRAIEGEFLHEEAHLIASLGERAFAHTRG